MQLSTLPQEQRSYRANSCEGKEKKAQKFTVFLEEEIKYIFFSSCSG